MVSAVRQMFAAGIAALLAAASIGTAWTDDSAPAATPYPQGINCVWMPLLDSYSLIDDEHLVFEVTSKQSYLVTLTRRCFDLDTSLDVKLARKGSQVCTGDWIVTDNDRCPIRYLEEVADYKEGKAIVEARDAAEKASRRDRGN